MRRKGQKRYALKCPRSNTWLILDAIESKAPKKNSSKMTQKICCAQGRCGSCVGNGVIHLNYTHRGTHPLFMIVDDPAVSTKASWLERASLLDGAGMIGIESRLISMHFVQQDCAMMNDSDIQTQDSTGKLYQIMLLMFGI